MEEVGQKLCLWRGSQVRRLLTDSCITPLRRRFRRRRVSAGGTAIAMSSDVSQSQST